MGVPADVRDGVVFLRVLRDGFGVVASYYVLPSIDRRWTAAFKAGLTLSVG